MCRPQGKPDPNAVAPRFTRRGPMVVGRVRSGNAGMAFEIFVVTAM